MKRGDYVLWFAQYGTITCQRLAMSLEKIVNWVATMDEESTHEYDDHGIPIDLEQVGSGIVPNFHELVRAREAELEAERKERIAEYQRQQTERRPEGPTYSIYLKPPAELAAANKHLTFYREGVALQSRLPFAELVAERDRLEAEFGRDRITVKECTPAATPA